MEKIELTPEQKKIILDAYQGGEKSLKILTKLAFPNVERAHGNTFEGRAVKEFLVKSKLEFSVLGVHIREKFDFTESQMEFIKNNYDKMPPVEICQNMFNDPKITNLHAVTRAVADIVKSLNPSAEILKE